MLHTALRAAVCVGGLALLGACTQAPHKPIGVTELTERPAERALMGALRAYDNADYALVERLAEEALRLGLQSRRDRASAHKLRAFVCCTSHRLTECEAAFRAARDADPQFALSHAEAGHPVWGPVYVRSRQ